MSTPYQYEYQLNALLNDCLRYHLEDNHSRFREAINNAEILLQQCQYKYPNLCLQIRSEEVKKWKELDIYEKVQGKKPIVSAPFILHE